MARDLPTQIEEQMAALREDSDQWARPHTVPILIMPHADAMPSEVIDSGTGCLIDTGERKMLVTAAHVYLGFQEYKCPANQDGTAYPDARLVIGGDTGNAMNLNRATIIDIEKKVDLVTMELPSDFQLEQLGKQYNPMHSWPPQRANAGDMCLVLGFPGVQRKPEDDEGVLNMGLAPIGDDITSTNDRHVIIADVDLQRVAHEYTPGTASLSRFGGLSGAGLFVVRDQKLELCAFASDATDEGIHSMIFAAHADFINPDGTFDRLRMPW